MTPMIDTTRTDELEARLEAARAADREGRWADALVLYEEGFALATERRDVDAVVSILRWMGTLHRERGELELAGEAYETSLAIAQAHGLTTQVASVLNVMAGLEQYAGDPDRAETLYVQARELAEAAGDQRLAGMVDQNMGALANIRGDLDGALDSYRSALDRARRTRDRHLLAAALNNMGMALVDLDRLGEAESIFDEAFEVAMSAGEEMVLGYVQLNRAEMHVKRQQYEAARQCCDDGLGVFSQLESRTGIAEAYKFYGIVYRETGKRQLADIHLELARSMAESAGNRLLQAEVQHELARVHHEESRNRDAIQSLNVAYRLYEQMQARREMLDIENHLTALEHSYVTVVRAWATTAIDSKDSYTTGHSTRVADLTRQLGEAMGVRGHQLVWLHVGALLHDMGKMTVPPTVLSKAGPLNQSEWQLMQRHTTVGDEIVRSLDLPYMVAPMARHHHERFDGTGYPDRIAGTDIPVEARMLAVADVYDALTSRRAYRKEFGPRKALEILHSSSGTQLDPVCVEAFTDSVWPRLTA